MQTIKINLNPVKSGYAGARPVKYATHPEGISRGKQFNGVNKITKKDIGLIVENLKQGKVVVYPTDTVYGLGCDARNGEAIKRINKIKDERGKKPLLILISNFKMLKKYCFVNLEQIKYLREIWADLTPAPSLLRRGGIRPVTVILKRRPNLPTELTGGLNSLAVRLPDNEFLIKIISEASFPIVSTSLNKKGEKPLRDVSNIETYFKYLPDLVMDAGVIKGKPSRLVDLRDVKNIKIIRK